MGRIIDTIRKCLNVEGLASIGRPEMKLTLNVSEKMMDEFQQELKEYVIQNGTSLANITEEGRLKFRYEFKTSKVEQLLNIVHDPELDKYDN